MKDGKIQAAFDAAAKARNNAHAPYSKFRVGAALVLENGEIVSGCNVENASYGGTICAERNAITAAVAQFGTIKPRALVLITDPEAMPCGLCLQVISEFCGLDFPMHLANPQGIQRQVTLRDLFPHPFGPEKLK